MAWFTILIFISVYIVVFGENETEFPPEFSDKITKLLRQSRRVLNGHEVGETRPYLVYLRRAGEVAAHDKNWLCGGVIIHKRFILTSAACISDAKHFYVISGTSKWYSHDDTSDCIENGAKRAIWKCVPKSYVYDGDEINNFRWMGNDIAVVKTEDDFNFNRRVKGCDFIPHQIHFNNVTEDLEKPGTIGTIAGWGSTDKFGDTMLRNTINSPVLLETDIKISTEASCKKVWEKQYHYLIQHGIICGRDNIDFGAMNNMCNEEQINCESLLESHELLDDARRADGGSAEKDARRGKEVLGGFCENDHGGPLIVGRGLNARVIGTITASQVSRTKRCRGPYLFTSVYYHRDLINCAVSKDTGEDCRRALENSQMKLEETHFDWTGIPRARQIKAATNASKVMLTTMPVRKPTSKNKKQPQKPLPRFKTTKINPIKKLKVKS